MQLQFTLKDINSAAREFLDIIGSRKVVAMEGEMGAGKTTFISAVAKALGSRDKISSPTFSLINEYVIPGGVMYHLDLYRLKDEKEAIDAGVEDCIYSGQLCMVEWPGKSPGLFPADVVKCGIVIAEDGLRKLDINL